MGALSYIFGLSRYNNRLSRRKKGYFIAGTIFNIVGSVLIYFFLLLGFACFGIDTSFASFGESIVGGLGSAIMLAVGIICILAALVTVVKNIPSQILIAVVGFKRSKTEGKAFMVCGIISILTIVALLVMVALMFVGI